MFERMETKNFEGSSTEKKSDQSSEPVFREVGFQVQITLV